MAVARRVAGKLILVAFATLIVSATGTRADWDKLLFSQNQSDLPASQSDRTEPKSSGPVKQDAAQWMALPEAVPFIDLPWRSFGTDFSGNIGSSKNFKGFDDTPSTSGSGYDGFQIGNSYLGIQMEKTIQGLDRFWRTDCPTDDECTDYSGLPKAGPSKKGTKNFRKPFFGLSITTPLQ